MRAREFTINIPINIKINGDGQPEIDMGQGSDGPADPSELKQDPPTTLFLRYNSKSNFKKQAWAKTAQ